ncbi:MAG: zinc ribbon domain-containing protein [Nitrospirales bacterium]|nr:zinc ribbon domain-containing protein [Nitrospira sp.]MDR4502599.1 zinc ribbon domain-containing protein [Nitrospirales bacterium]
MPIYEYVCTACNEKFEVQRKFSDPPIKTCAEFSCPKGEPVEKIISSPAIMFKGSGWYVTDYSDKLKEPKRPGEDGKPQGKTEGGKTEGKTEGTASSSGSSASTDSSSTSSTTKDSSSSTSTSSSGASSPNTSSSSSSGSDKT